MFKTFARRLSEGMLQINEHSFINEIKKWKWNKMKWNEMKWNK